MKVAEGAIAHHSKAAAILAPPDEEPPFLTLLQSAAPPRKAAKARTIAAAPKPPEPADIAPAPTAQRPETAPAQIALRARGQSASPAIESTDAAAVSIAIVAPEGIATPPATATGPLPVHPQPAATSLSTPSPALKPHVLMPPVVTPASSAPSETASAAGAQPSSVPHEPTAEHSREAPAPDPGAIRPAAATARATATATSPQLAKAAAATAPGATVEAPPRPSAQILPAMPQAALATAASSPPGAGGRQPGQRGSAAAHSSAPSGTPAAEAPGTTALPPPPVTESPAASARASARITIAQPADSAFSQSLAQAGSFRSEAALGEPGSGAPPAPLAEASPAEGGMADMGGTTPAGVADVVIALSQEAGMDVTLAARSEASADRLVAEQSELRADLAALGTEVEAIRVELRSERMPDGRAGGSASGWNGQGNPGDQSMHSSHHFGRGFPPSPLAGPAATAAAGKVDRYA